MIEIKTSKSPAPFGRMVLIDGAVVPHEDASVIDYQLYESQDLIHATYDVGIRSQAVAERIVKHHFSDLILDGDDLNICINPQLLGLPFEYEEFDCSVIIKSKVEERIPFRAKFELQFSFDFRAEEWKRPWSIKEFSDEFRLVEYAESIEGCEFNFPMDKRFRNDLSGGFQFTFPIPLGSVTVRTEIERHAPKIESLLKTVENNLLQRIHQDSLVIPFNFPEEIRTSCEQYLLYFAQFLKDIGVEATADVQHEANRVLFSVTPSEGKEALEQIRQLLGIYLDLPKYAKTSTSMILDGEIEVQRLAATIQHLNGDLMLGQALIRTQMAELQAKDATIEAKEATILQLKQGNVLTQSMLMQSTTANDEDVVSSIFKFKPIDLKIGDLDLNALYKFLRQWTKHKKEDGS